jgi:uncharacterized membrane protein YjfL (UPF0719 family)
VTDIPLLNAVIFAALGVAIFGAALALFVKALPFDLWSQIVQERNTAAAIFAAAVALGLGWIIAATMH